MTSAKNADDSGAKDGSAEAAATRTKRKAGPAPAGREMKAQNKRLCPEE